MPDDFGLSLSLLNHELTHRLGPHGVREGPKAAFVLDLGFEIFEREFVGLNEAVVDGIQARAHFWHWMNDPALAAFPLKGVFYASSILFLDVLLNDLSFRVSHSPQDLLRRVERIYFENPPVFTKEIREIYGEKAFEALRRMGVEHESVLQTCKVFGFECEERFEALRQNPNKLLLFRGL